MATTQKKAKKAAKKEPTKKRVGKQKRAKKAAKTLETKDVANCFLSLFNTWIYEEWDEWEQQPQILIHEKVWEHPKLVDLVNNLDRAEWWKAANLGDDVRSGSSFYNDKYDWEFATTFVELLFKVATDEERRSIIDLAGKLGCQQMGSPAQVAIVKAMLKHRFEVRAWKHLTNLWNKGKDSGLGNWQEIRKQFPAKLKAGT